MLKRLPNTSPFTVLVLLLGGCLVGLYALATWSFVLFGTESKQFGWASILEPGGTSVMSVERGGPADGALQVGDRLVRIGGRDVGYGWPFLQCSMIAPGTEYTVRIERDGTERDVVLYLPNPVRDLANVAHITARVAAGLAFLAFGLALGLLRTEHRSARLGSLLFLGLASFALALAVDTILYSASRSLVAFHAANMSLMPLGLALGYHYFSEFPPGVSRSRTVKRLGAVLYAAGTACATPGLIGVAAIARDVPPRNPLELPVSIFYASFRLFFPVVMVTMAATGWVILRNYRAVTDPLERRRVQWVVYGSGAVAVLLLVPVAVAGVVAIATDRVATNVLYSGVLFDYLLFVALIMPASVAYGIFRYQVFDVRVVIRRSVHFALAKGLVQFALALPVVSVLISIAANPNRTLADLFTTRTAFVFVPFLVLAAASVRYRRPLLGWLDRRYFREAYDRERVLVALIEDLKHADSMDDVARRATSELDHAIHPKRMHLLFSDEADLHLCDSEEAGCVTIPRDSALVRALDGREGAIETRDLEVSPDGVRVLDELGVALVVPIAASGGRLVGLLLFGERRSEEPYSDEDKRLFEAVSTQLGLAHENSALKRRVDRDRRLRRDVLARVDDRGIALVRECPVCGMCYDATESKCSDDGAALDISVPFERLIDGKYRLDRLLGRGGMGAVYAASDVRLDRRVAVKLMLGGGIDNHAALARFEREARASARLSHMNIATVYDFGEVQGQGAYLVMEYLDGRSLRAELKSARRLTFARTARLFDEIFDAIVCAHSSGVIHRDLKPENVLVCAMPGGRDTVKVLDFGIAKLRFDEGAAVSALTAPGAVMGTLGYMSPEQLTGGTVDQRTDLFALGVMVFECVTGRQPFRGATWAEMVASLRETEVRLGNDAPGIDRLEQAVRRALAVDPRDRYESAAQMSGEVLSALRGCIADSDPGIGESSEAAVDNEAETKRLNDAKRSPGS